MSGDETRCKVGGHLECGDSLVSVRGVGGVGGVGVGWKQ